jgi:hypothetical protein
MHVVDTWKGRHATALRRALRLTNEGFAEQLGTAVRTVARWNAEPDLVPVVELQRALDTALDQAPPDAQTRFALSLHGDVGDNGAPGEGSTGFVVRSHKFIPACIGAAGTAALVDKVAAEPEIGLLGGHWSAPVDHEAGPCTMHIWSHGVVIYHLVEEITHPSLSDFASWRYESYEENLAWAGEQIERITGAPGQAMYVLSAYWLPHCPWPARYRETALKIVCVPRAVHCVGASGRSAEARLLRDGFENTEIESFGIADCSLAYASWAGVVYHPLDETRALSETDLVGLELAVQALWVYCSALAARVEEGVDPEVDATHGWKWLRASRSRLTTARTQESSPHRAMREAILSTSGLPAMLDEAITILREAYP